MASWMVHLRIADKLLSNIPDISPAEFTVGNMAPDSGIPNKDWSSFSPGTHISHFKSRDKKADPAAFADKYFTRNHQKEYDKRQYSFYLGYLTHLITDVLWSEQIARPTLQKYAKTDAPDREDFIWRIKEDWYDLDFKYLRDHPDFRAFKLYTDCVGFQNTYMEEFPPDAFDNRREYITSWYLNGKDNLDREYPYLLEAQMNCFVEDVADLILSQLKDHWLL